MVGPALPTAGRPWCSTAPRSIHLRRPAVRHSARSAARLVIDVVDRGRRDRARLARPLRAGAEVAAPSTRRGDCDHMQQHTGQHILSAAFDHLFPSRPSAFTWGPTSPPSTSRRSTPDDVERAVDEANRIVWENRPVTVRFASADEARTMGLRKESAHRRAAPGGREDFDLSACGGTHVPRTGTIGVIPVTGREATRAARVSFVCGGRAVRHARAVRDVVTGSVRGSCRSLQRSLWTRSRACRPTRRRLACKPVRLASRSPSSRPSDSCATPLLPAGPSSPRSSIATPTA